LIFSTTFVRNISHSKNNSCHKRHDFSGKNKLLNTKCVFWFFLQLLSETFLILTRTEWDVTRNMYRSSCHAPQFLARFELNFNFLDRFSKNTQISWKSVKWETERHDEAIIAFRNLTIAPENWRKLDVWPCMVKDWR